MDIVFFPIPPISRKQPQSRLTNPFEEPPAPEDTVIPDVANAGDAFRDAYFALQARLRRHDR